MSFIVVIPARYQSTRLPGKPLLKIAGKPMLQHVIERARQSSASSVCVATDNAAIEAFCKSFGVQVCMTDAALASGSDRIEEVTRILGLDDDDIVVNVQGDEPLIPPAVINQVAKNLQTQPRAGLCSLYEIITNTTEINDPNIVKTVTDHEDMALYFSRAPIPYDRDKSTAVIHKRHVGLYAYKVKTLRSFVGWPQSMLEQSEKLEQLRFMAYGIKIHMAQSCESIPPGIDTEADLQNIRVLME